MTIKYTIYRTMKDLSKIRFFFSLSNSYKRITFIFYSNAWKKEDLKMYEK